MKLVKIDPPGSFCTYQAVFDLLNGLDLRHFIEVGCGGGELSYQLCRKGLSGVGLDFSPQAIEQASVHLRPFIDQGQYHLLQGDFMAHPPGNLQQDLGISLMVMEHVENDVGFVQNLSAMVRPGGYVLIGVPGRKDKWSIEDETVGHLRRYDREDLQATLAQAGLEQIKICSVAVPTANILFGLGNRFIQRSQIEMAKRQQDKHLQTAASGVREIPFKTVFPAPFKLLLNPYTLYPLFVLQRLFYHTGLGLTMLGIGRVRHP